jgi:hypothetical protein
MGKPRERQFIVDYIMARFPTRRVIFSCPLGQVPEKLIATFGQAKALKIGRGIRPEVDALVFDGHTLVLIEAKIKNWLNGIAKLPVYAGMVDDTPELAEYRGWPRRMILCLPFTSESVASAARAAGVEVDEFSTPDVASYLTELEKYWTPEYRSRRAELLRARELLGLE